MSQQSSKCIVKRLWLALLGGLYGVFLLYVGRPLAGLGLLMWPFFGFVLADHPGKGMGLLLITLLSLHYAGLGWWIVFVDHGWSYIAKCFGVAPLIVTTIVLVYLAGQAAIWYF